MKKLILTYALFYISTFTLFADSITEMSEWQAKKIVSYLQAETYLIPYCDCCDNSPLQIVEIQNVSIEPTENNLFQVRVRGKIIATFTTDQLGRLENPKESSKYFNEIIPLNYTFIPQNNKVISIASGLGIGEVDGYEVHTCQQFIDMPLPSLSIFQNNTKYFEWYNKHFEKIDYLTSLSGSWKMSMILNQYGDRITEGIPAWRISFKSDKSYFTNIGEGEIGKWSIEGNEIKTTSDESNEIQFMPFYLDGDVLQIKQFSEKEGLIVIYFDKQQ